MNNEEKLKKYKEEREGKRFLNKYNEWFTIIKYNNAKSLLVKFDNGYAYEIEWKQITKGTVHSPYARTIYNIGCIGKGKYKPYIAKNKKTLAYIVWCDMLKRCYDPYYLNKRPTYIDCYVCDEWLNFQNFAKWFYKHYYKCNNEKMNLDKDILFKGNKIYSPETCIFSPERINTLFTKSDEIRGKYPIGVHYHKQCKKLQAQCSIYNKSKKKKEKMYLGLFPIDKPFQAFTCYKTFKESYIKQVADEYKDLIPKKLYEAMYKYEVEIND